MTIKFYVHSVAKRAKVVVLLNLEAIKNFMNLSYIKWLCLPIKKLPEERKLLNVNGMEKKSGKL
jgi:hypothetical protein